MSYRQQRGGGGRYDADPWLNGNSWGNQQMWQGGHGGQGYGGYGGQGSHQQGGYYPPGPPQRQAPRQHYPQASRAYNQRPLQQQHQGLNRGVKRPANFNNGVTVVKRMRNTRGPAPRGPKAGQLKKETKDECVVLDDTDKKSQEGFCKICQEKFDGTYNQHKLTKPHREKRAQKYPSCGPCGLKFNGDDARQRYEVHLGSKAHMQVVETAELEVKEGQEPEGTELCEAVDAAMCTLCECVFRKELTDIHCKTKGHLKRITKKKAEAERAAKKAEDDAKKAAGGTTTEEEKPSEENGGEAAEENGDDAEDDVEDDYDEEEEEGDQQEDAEATTEAAAEEEPAAAAEAAEAETTEEAAAPAAEETPVAEEAPVAAAAAAAEPEVTPEPAKASPVKRTPARRGRGRGRK